MGLLAHVLTFRLVTAVLGPVSIKLEPLSLHPAAFLSCVCVCARSGGVKETFLFIFLFYFVNWLPSMLTCAALPAPGLAWNRLNVLTLLVLTGSEKRQCREVKGNYSLFLFIFI